MRFSVSFYFLIVVAALLSACQSTEQEEASTIRPPNIVLILADDFGVGDIQAHYPDNKIATPYLDSLVRSGMSFTDAHSGSAVCTPTRYGLMTGRYAWRTALQEWVIACYEPPLISEDRLTLPGYLQDKGYQTACVGKWHLGWNWVGEERERRLEQRNVLKTAEWDFTAPIAEGPITRGFDYYFGTHVPNFPPFTFIENDRVVDQPTEKYVYSPDQGVVMPRGFEGAPIAPGWRFDQILPKLTKKAVSYIQEKAKEEDPFFLYFSMTSPHEPVSPSPDFAGKSGIAPIADFVMETDWSAGQVIKAVDEAGIGDNTIIIFTADNGHSRYTGWDKLVEAGHQPSGPYRGHKGNIWEGGHRVPFVVRWPGKITPNSKDDQLLCLNDVFATCAEIVGQEDLPEDAAEDSFSFLSVLTGEGKGEVRKNLVSHSVGGEFAYRAGPWKLVYKLPTPKLAGARGQAAVPELYQLQQDIAEAKDLSANMPEKLEELHEALHEVVNRGTSRAGKDQSNDVQVQFDTIQTKRWYPEIQAKGE